MAETQKTELVRIVFAEERELAKILRAICRKVQDQARGDMTLPSDPKDRLIALNMMHNVFDRLDAALDWYVANGADTVRVFKKEDGHDQEQGATLAMAAEGQR